VLEGYPGAENIRAFAANVAPGEISHKADHRKGLAQVTSDSTANHGTIFQNLKFQHRKLLLARGRLVGVFCVAHDYLFMIEQNTATPFFNFFK
jgi:hypothetical protein